MTLYTHDLAISAVPYDAILVTELSEQLTPRLRSAPFWAGNTQYMAEDATSALLEDSSRLAVVLHQRLWSHDERTRADEAALSERVRRCPGSVVVVTLDNSPVPEWLTPAPRCDFTAVGLAGAADFALEAIRASGGSPRRPEPARPTPADAQKRWPEGPPPFLAQPRALSALRRELDALAAQLEPRLQIKESRGTDRIVELHVLPNRLIARLDDVGISFSWVAGRLGTVGDGRLLVIQWKGVTTQARGIRALKSATPSRECVYHAEGTGPESWRWRADDPNGRACSTANLAAEWVAGASMAAGE